MTDVALFDQSIPGNRKVIQQPDGTYALQVHVSDKSRTNTHRSTPVTHRTAITLPELVSSTVGAITTINQYSWITTDDTTNSGLVANTAYKAAVAAWNKYGITLSSPTSLTTANDGGQHCIRLGITTAASNADGYDIFLSTDTNPKFVGRITNAQLAAGGCRITAMGVVDAAGGNAAGTVLVCAVGTGVANNASPYNVNNCFAIPAGITPIDCTGYSRAHVYVEATLTDHRSAAAVTLVFLEVNPVTGKYIPFASAALTLGGALTSTDVAATTLTVDGASALIILAPILTGQGVSINVYVELA